MDYHAFFFLKIEIYRKYQKRKKELNGIHGLLTDFFIFPGQFFTTNMEYGVWGGAANFEKLTFSERFWKRIISLQTTLCKSKNETI